jgi:hypothetical protein
MNTGRQPLPKGSCADLKFTCHRGLASLMITYRVSISLIGYPPAARGVKNIRQYRAEMRKGIPVAIQSDANLQAEQR